MITRTPQEGKLFFKRFHQEEAQRDKHCLWREAQGIKGKAMLFRSRTSISQLSTKDHLEKLIR